MTDKGDVILFLYSYRPNDLLHPLISGPLALMSNDPSFLVRNVSDMNQQEIVQFITQNKPRRVILNGHGSGGMNFHLREGVKFDLQDDNREIYNTIAESVKELLLLTCHVSQISGMGFLGKTPQFFHIRTEFTLSFANYNTIILQIIENPNAPWEFVKEVSDVDEDVYLPWKTQRMEMRRAALLNQPFQPAQLDFDETVNFIDMQDI
jgi:hypothetical protein